MDNPTTTESIVDIDDRADDDATVSTCESRNYSWKESLPHKDATLTCVETPAPISVLNGGTHDEAIMIPLVATSGDNDFDETCQLAIRLGVAAMAFGSTADKTEAFLENLMRTNGFEGIFRCSNTEIMCSFQKRCEESDAIKIYTQIVPLTLGVNLNKLGLLSDLSRDVLNRQLSIRQAQARLQEIHRQPDPFGAREQLLAFLVIGAALAILLRGTWWDVMAGSAASMIMFLLLMLFEKLPKRASVWINLTSSFLCSAFGASLKLLRPEVDTTIVTICGVAALIPGTTVTLGITDLVSNHVISGTARFINGTVIMLWLVLGHWLALNLVASLVSDERASSLDMENAAEPVSVVWQLLFVPMICVAVTVVFQLSHRDVPWGVLCMAIAYCASFVSSLFQRGNLGTFFASTAMTIFANLWSRYFDRPNTIVLLPAFLLTVSGIVGFMGLTGILNGETQEGTSQFLQMFIVAALIIAGMLAGSTIVQPETTI